MNNLVSRVKKGVRNLKNLKKDERGMELFQLIIVAIIAIIIGGVVLNFFDVSITELGTLMVNKAKSIFSL